MAQAELERVYAVRLPQPQEHEPEDTSRCVCDMTKLLVNLQLQLTCARKVLEQGDVPALLSSAPMSCHCLVISSARVGCTAESTPYCATAHANVAAFVQRS